MTGGEAAPVPAGDGGRPWWADLGDRLAEGTLDVSSVNPIGAAALAVPGVPDAAVGRPIRQLSLPGIARGDATAAPEPVLRPTLAPLPDAAWIAGLLTLPHVGPTRLRNLLAAFGPAGAWARVLDGSLVDRPELGGSLGALPWPAVLAGWQRAAREVDVDGYWADHVRARVGVSTHGSPGYPRCLVDDPEPPAALFHWGDPGVIAGQRVAIVGTRRCSERGRRLADQMGFELGREGVRVVSGLALGIDGAAHQGALRAFERGGGPPIGVVGSGLDVVYPPRHRELWRSVARHGVLFTEMPLGARPSRWGFPARNRILAGLADVVVVIESGETGGSLYTAEEAERRGVPVLAVPGPVGLRVGVGTNRLIQDGAGVVLSTADVLVHLGLLASAAGGDTAGCVAPSTLANAVLEALGWRPASLAEVVERLRAPVPEVVEAVVELGRAGWIAETHGWLERVAP